MSNNFIGVSNSTMSKNSTDCLLNLLQMNILSGGGGNNVVPPSSSAAVNISNTNSILTVKPNFFHQSLGLGSQMSGGQQAMMQQQQQHQQQPQQQQQQQLPQQKISGRPIINTGNLASNHHQQGQQQKQQPDIFSALNSGTDLSEFKNALRIMSSDTNIGGQKQYRNGEGKCLFNYLLH